MPEQWSWNPQPYKEVEEAKPHNESLISLPGYISDLVIEEIKPETILNTDGGEKVKADIMIEINHKPFSFVVIGTAAELKANISAEIQNIIEDNTFSDTVEITKLQLRRGIYEEGAPDNDYKDYIGYVSII